MPEMKTYAFGPAQDEKPRKIVLMLHGYGSNGQDLIGLAPHLAQELPGVLFLSPDAPQPFEGGPGFGYQWFSLRSFDADYMLEGARGAAPVLDAYIDALLAQTGLAESDLALLGFSQGTMMSLYAGPCRPNPVAGILGYSGALLAAEEMSGPALHRVPGCLIHGEADDVVPVSMYHDARRALEQAHYPVEGMTVPGLPHSIDEGGIAYGAAFLQKIFAA